ncbi:MAG: DNA phosphorothioation system sulfurtransferase DndC [Candidatus Viridilinea halotolerans]|uniref:DNA phosphorothioation system sulfurtransferase DndC n=1 Tax=Candidatus Viridilinea halotolerans TaxID=2491704 RepID=A0A426U070_9CHLR|nr:MAG: DNA phosphorothioation system sulfurtransferase DndC [Candidatus Viridilinea halotolerans]
MKARHGLPSEKHSFFEQRTLDDLYQEIREVYSSTQLPWVIGYSGGKDSTATLQLVWQALVGLPREELRWPIYVIASDTLVETPVIVDYLDGTLGRINEAAQAQALPFEAQKVMPQINDTFWVNLIGRGYPAPNQRFRWCTERMKIQPANRFILDRAAEFGEVVMVLGGRKSESASRAQVITSKHGRITGSRLSRHHILARAYVYTPIEDFTTDDVWTYLLQVASPWGSNNRDLAALYRTAHAGECPLVVDDTTPSCGNSRFGCWTCTVVTRDRSMEAMIDNGEDWMQPMLDFRDWLAETQDPAKKHLYRDFKRRSGQVTVKEGKLIRGPYTLEFCKEILRELLHTQKAVQEDGPDPTIALINAAELHEIRRIWRTERQDWEDTVPRIYAEVTKQNLAWLQDDIGAFSSQEYNLLGEVCTKHDLPTDLVARLLEHERQMQGMHRRSGIFQRIDDVLREEWRDEETVRREHNLPLPGLGDTEVEEEAAA